MQDGVADGVAHLVEVIVRAVDGLHAIFYLTVSALQAVGPKSETGQVGRDAGHMERHRLRWRVAPRLVVGGEHRQILTNQQVVVLLVEDAVAAIQIARHEDDLHPVFRTVVHVEPVHLTQHLVVVLLVQHMRDARVANRTNRHSVILLLGQSSLEVFACLFHPCRHHDEGQHVLFQAVVPAQTVHRIDIDIDALVLVFVASASRDDDGAVVQIGAHQGVGHFQQFGSGCLSGCVEGCSRRRHEVVLKTVHQKFVSRLVQQGGTFLTRDFAHRREAVHVPCGLLLHRVLRLHTQLRSHLVTIVGRQIVVQGLVVASDGTPCRRRVGCKDGGHLGHVLLNI